MEYTEKTIMLIIFILVFGPISFAVFTGFIKNKINKE